MLIQIVSRYLSRNNAFLLASVIVPLQDLSGWQLDKYSHSEAPEVRVGAAGMDIGVNGSAGPIIFPFSSPISIEKLSVRGEIFSFPSISDIKLEGEPKFDDLVLRVGLVSKGEHTLSGIKKLLAKSWVKRLFALAPPGTGIGQIHFFSIVQNQALLGKKRSHPNSELIEEKFVHWQKQPGIFAFEHSITPPIEVLAIWLSSDGDDTKSKFRLRLTELTLQTSKPPTATAPIITEKAVLAGGCFWCLEPPYDALKSQGVINTRVGYAGGTLAQPTYEAVSSGGTGHREVIEVEFDPERITLEKILAVFWENIDPVDLDGQFCDRGFQYSSAFYAANEAQARAFSASKMQLEKRRPDLEIITPLEKPATFYPAEDYHQDYYLKNPLRYKYYRNGCKRDARLKELWRR